MYVRDDRFTARGIVALVFSVLAAVLGMAVIVVYGMAEPVATVVVLRGAGAVVGSGGKAE